MKKYYPEGALDDQSTRTATWRLRRWCRSSSRRQRPQPREHHEAGANLKNFELALLLPG